MLPRPGCSPTVPHPPVSPAFRATYCDTGLLPARQRCNTRENRKPHTVTRTHTHTHMCPSTLLPQAPVCTLQLLYICHAAALHKWRWPAAKGAVRRARHCAVGTRCECNCPVASALHVSMQHLLMVIVSVTVCAVCAVCGTVCAVCATAVCATAV